MTIIRFVESTCTHCGHQWKTDNQISGNNFSVPPEEPAIKKSRDDRWREVLWKEAQSPYRCSFLFCKSFNVEYKVRYPVYPSDHLAGNKSRRVDVSEIGEYFQDLLYRQMDYWDERTDLTEELCSVKRREVEATILLMYQQIEDATPQQRDELIKEIDGHIELLRMLAFEIDDQLLSEKSKGFGYEIDKPIAARSIKDGHDYLDRLMTAENQKVTYQRKGSVVNPNLKQQVWDKEQMRIDIYEIFTEDDQIICELFICPYLRKSSYIAPAGFKLETFTHPSFEETLKKLAEIKAFEEQVAQGMLHVSD